MMYAPLDLLCRYYENESLKTDMMRDKKKLGRYKVEDKPVNSVLPQKAIKTVLLCIKIVDYRTKQYFIFPICI